MRYTTEQRNALIDTIRAVFNTLRHHEKWGTGKRFETALRKALKSDVGYCLYCGVEYGMGKISVWGNGADFNNRIYLGFNLNGWAVELEREIQREDTRDVQERETQEAALDVEFSKAELVIKALETRIEAIRAAAIAKIAALPMPKAATLRTSDWHWTHPTFKTQTQYPALFGK